MRSKHPVSRAFSTLLLSAFSVLALASTAEAKCFAFRDRDLRVCIDGDDNAARRAATAVCERVSSESCAITGYSGSCSRSSSVRCYDAQGEEQRSITSD